MDKAWRCHHLEEISLVTLVTSHCWVFIILELLIVPIFTVERQNPKTICIVMCIMKALLLREPAYCLTDIENINQDICHERRRRMRSIEHCLLQSFKIDTLLGCNGLLQGYWFCVLGCWTNQKLSRYAFQCTEKIYRKKVSHSMEELFENLNHSNRVTIHQTQTEDFFDYYDLLKSFTVIL